ncbi:MAG: GMC family oxidoreductase [Acidobacteria bacterium]|nr:MAG: GMC family oxidoreductase [Acidobacteriota bacterium]
MLLDASEVPLNGTVECRVCIVGAGPAGVSIALGLPDVDVVLLESGGRRLERATQDLYRGEVAEPDQHHPLHLFRRRVLGGTSSVWGGRCVPLDDIDFQRRDYVPHSGWPITKSDLDPFYARANGLCEAGAFAYEADDRLPSGRMEMIEGFDGEDVVSRRLERWSVPTDFGKRYLPTLKRSGSTRLVLHANCTAIQLDEQGRSVAHVTVSTIAGHSFRVRARYYVLAAGGLETTRILLASRDVQGNGIGNDSGLLGRYYMSHLVGATSVVRVSPDRAVIDGFERDASGVYCRRRMWITEAAQKKHQILNFIAYFHRPRESDAAHRSGALSLLHIMKSLRIWAREGTLITLPSCLRQDDLRDHLRNLVLDAPGLARISLLWLRGRVFARRKLPILLFPLSGATTAYTLKFWAEQSPNPASVVSLGSEKDRFGMPRLRVEWRFNEADVRSIAAAHRLIGEQLRRSGAGRLECYELDVGKAIRDQIDASAHHMGTTRMARAREERVVDENCRVHGVENLYVASSSVFPTAGHANPTLTVLALALRLAEHLRLRGD